MKKRRGQNKEEEEEEELAELTIEDISQTGIEGSSMNDDIHFPTPRQGASQSIVSNVLENVRIAGSSISSLNISLLNLYLLQNSNDIIYPNYYSSLMSYNSSWECLQYKPEIIDESLEPIDGYDKFATVNEDYRCWLTLYDTPIDYPTVQGTDNLHYAMHNLYGETSTTGSIYLDMRNANDCSDSYNIIYGHHMSNGGMFGALDNYENEAYLYEHRSGVLVSNSGVYDLTVFAVAKTDAYEQKIYSVGNRADRVRKFLKNGGQNSTIPDSTEVLFYDENEAQSVGKILALSTCRDAETNGRLVVFLKMNVHNMLTLDVAGFEGSYDGYPHYLEYYEANNPEALIEFSTDNGKTWTDVPPELTDRGTLDVLVRATLGADQVQEYTQIIIN